MCYMALIPVAIALVQGVAGANQAKNQGAYQAFMAEKNAAFAEDAAEDAIVRGELNADEQRKKTQQTIGSQRTAFAGNGIDVNSGTAAIVQQDAAELGELDALTISNNAAREAYGYKVQASNDRTNAQYATANAESSAFGSLLGGASSAAGSYYGATA